MIISAIFRGKKHPHCSLAGDGDVCDRKPRRFAIANFGALTLRFGEFCWGGVVL